MYKLLIVDDEPLVRRGIKSLVDFDSLKISEVKEASNGEDALEMFKDYLPDIVLVDINMPKINGLSFSEKAKIIKPSVKIAIITGYDYFDYALQAIKIGVDDYILKPVSKSDVQNVIQKLIWKIQELETQKEINKTIESIIGIKKDPMDDNYKELIKSIIDNELSNSEFSLKSLSDELGYSSGYLSGLFKKNFGITFKEYLIRQRIEKAKILLLSTELKHYEIAELVGISDVNYFSARFKKEVGESPKNYKERVMGINDKEK